MPPMWSPGSPSSRGAFGLSSKARRVVVFGLDSMCWEVVERVAPAMPTLARLAREGAKGILQSTLPPITPVAWTSMVTGTPPGFHGVYEFVHHTPRGWQPVSRREAHAPYLDEILDDFGRKSVLVNLPLSSPGRSSAVRLADFLSADATPVDPPDLAERIPSLRSYRPFSEGGPIAARSPQDMALDMTRLEKERWRAAQALLAATEEWDFLFYGVTGTDHLHHRVLDRVLAGDLFPEARAFYQLVDQVLAWAVDLLGPQDLLLVVSDHGSAVFYRELSLNHLLESWGLLRWTVGSTHDALSPRGAKDALWGLAFQLGLDRVARALRRPLGLGRRRSSGVSFDVDAGASRAYMPTRFAWPAVYTPGVPPEELAQRLREVKDPQTGQRAFAHVWTADEVYGPQRRPGAPDVVLLPSPGVCVHPGRTSELWRTVRKNHHQREGMLVAYGGAARYLPPDLGTRRVEDICPTVLQALDVPVPTHVVGRSLLPQGEPSPLQQAVRQALASRGLLHRPPA